MPIRSPRHRLTHPNDDRELLRSIADSVLRSLRTRQDIGEFALRLGSVGIEPTDTRGWRCVLGHSMAPPVTFEIWFDHFLGQRGRVIWFGVVSKKPKVLAAARGALEGHFGQAQKVDERQVVSSRGYYHLRRGQSVTGAPVFERYGEPPAYFGLYRRAVLPSSGQPYGRLISHIADCCCRSFGALSRTGLGEGSGGSQRTSIFVFWERFKHFLEAVRANSGSEFHSFHEGLPREWEGYKEEIFHSGRQLLNWVAWKRKEIGTGRILKRVIQVIEIAGDTRSARNNLVAWSARYGPKSASHRALLQAQSNRERTAEFEEVFFKFYHNQIEHGAAFERLRALAGRRYDLLGYLFFLKDWERFMPIAPSTFDQAFRLLRIDLRTSMQCSWENYQRYNSALQHVQRMLRREAGVPWVRLIDAHSFCWMLARLRIPDKLPSIHVPTPEPLGEVEVLPESTRAHTDAGEGRHVDFDDLSKQRREVGGLAEDIALEAEQNRLRQAGRTDLAKLVKSVSEDHLLGYDILSFNDDGTPRFIEVKAAREAAGGISFYLTENEWEKSRSLSNYFFYLVFNPRFDRRCVKWLRPDQVQRSFLKPLTHFVEFRRDGWMEEP